MESPLITSLEILASEKEYNTDKNTTHSYLELYDQLFLPYTVRPINLLEIGNHNGGSLELWDDYFPRAEFYGLELNDLDTMAELDKRENMHLTRGIDAYSGATVDLMRDKGVLFDILIDDGSHQPVHQIYVIQKYLEFVKKGGIMVIEDVLNIQTAGMILENTHNLRPSDRAAIFDRRNVKGQADDIVIVIKRGQE